jgi:two-component sensor histidine kinase
MINLPKQSGLLSYNMPENTLLIKRKNERRRLSEFVTANVEEARESWVREKRRFSSNNRNLNTTVHHKSIKMNILQINHKPSFSLILASAGALMLSSWYLFHLNRPEVIVIFLSLTVAIPFLWFMGNHFKLSLSGKSAEIEILSYADNRSQCLSMQLLEKELLIKEIHHRVKNNMQVVISLLNTQSLTMEDIDAASILRNSEHRIYAMSLIHQKLYHSDNLKSINLPNYIRELSEYLKECLAPDNHIDFHYELEELSVDIEHATPLGLILNEAISNAIKHAFKGRERGEIRIKLSQSGGQKYTLTIEDNGIGLNRDFDPSRPSSMGMTLIHGLANQLGGGLNLTSDHGLCISVMFNILSRSSSSAA